ncbi:MAG: beta-ketoacyl synthase N-terminal-like domain-containing protein, partial [Pseudomonadota bacterium]
MKAISILGWGARLPGCNSVEDFRNVLHSGCCTVQELGNKRWPVDHYYHPDPRARGMHYARHAGLVDDIWEFDAGFFGISPREAAELDPQQRMLLEVVQAALDDAGLTSAGLAGSRTGVFVGASSSDHSNRFNGDLAAIDAQFMTGNTLSILSNRISYLYDLRGPSMTVDTACSSALYALHLAKQSIAAGECDSAIVGTVNALLAPLAFVGFSRATMLSRTGLCRAFDAAADGYVRAEGAVALVLRRADLAKRGGDRVRADLVATGVNMDGRTTGMTLPASERQRALMETVRDGAGIRPDDLAFVEAHGTGTPVGDPIEAEAIGKAYGAERSASLPVGSAKSNVGHLEPAAGLVGLLKAQIALDDGMLPASLHLDDLNPAIDFEALNLAPAQGPVTIPKRRKPWLAAVNAFGFGGANAHAVIRQVKAPPRASSDTSGAPATLVLSASSEKALGTMVADWSARLAAASPAEIQHLANDAAWRRDRREHRLVALADDPSSLADILGKAAKAHAGGAAKDDRIIRGRAGGGRGRTAFVFSGNGSQWPGMARRQIATDQAFAAAFDTVAGIVRDMQGPDLRALVEDPEIGEALKASTYAQPLLFAAQVAQVESLAAHGLVPDAVAGHSVGEVAAAWASGALSLKDATHLVVCRSRSLEAIHGCGSMAAVGAGMADTEAALAAFHAASDDKPGPSGARPAPGVNGDANGAGRPALVVAADNSPRSSTISGPSSAIAAFRRFARARRLAVLGLNIDYPYHSGEIDRIKRRLIADLVGLVPAASQRDFVSATYGKAMPGEALDCAYWWRNARLPVRFREAVDALLGLGCTTFLEIGPRPVLQAYLRDTASAASTDIALVPGLDDNQRAGWDGRRMAAEALGIGAEVDMARFAGPQAAVYRGGLPAYPWDRERLTNYPSSGVNDLFGIAEGTPADPLLGRSPTPSTGPWTTVIDTQRFTWLADHRVGDEAILPAAALAHIALEAGRRVFAAASGGAGARGGAPAAPGVEIADLNLLRPVVLSKAARIELRTSVEGGTGIVRIEGRTHLSDAAFVLHALGQVRVAASAAGEMPAPLPSDGATSVDRGTVYRALAQRGLDYGPAFQLLQGVELAPDMRDRAEGDALSVGMATLGVPVAGGSMVADRVCLTDAAFHAILPLLAPLSDGGHPLPPSGTTLVPVRIGRLTVWDEAAQAVSAQVSIMHASPYGIEAKLDLADAAGRRTMRLDGLRLAPIPRAQPAEAPDFWQTRWIAAPDASAPPMVAGSDALATAAREAGLVADALPQPTEALLIADAITRRTAWDCVAPLAAPDGRIETTVVAPEARRLLEVLVAMLGEDGAVTPADGALGVLADKPPHPDRANLVALLAEIAPEIGDEVPRLLALEGVLTARLARPAQPDAADPDATDPGATDPGATDPGATDPGATDAVSTALPAPSQANGRHAALWTTLAALAETSAPAGGGGGCAILLLGKPTAAALARISAAAPWHRVVVADPETGDKRAAPHALPTSAALQVATVEEAAAMGGFDLVLADDRIRAMARPGLTSVLGALREGGVIAVAEPAGGTADRLFALLGGSSATRHAIDLEASRGGIGALLRRAGAEVTHRLPMADPTALGQLCLATAGRPATRHGDDGADTARNGSSASASDSEHSTPPPTSIILHGEGAGNLAADLAETLRARGAPARISAFPAPSTQQPTVADPALNGSRYTNGRGHATGIGPDAIATPSSAANNGGPFETSGDEARLIVLPPTTGTATERLATTAEAVRTALHATELSSLWLIGGDALADTVGAGIGGLARSIANERPQIAVGRIGVSRDLQPDVLAAALGDALSRQSAEREYRITSAGLTVPRIEPRMITQPIREGAAPDGCEARDAIGRRLVRDASGRIDGMRWRPHTRAAPGPGEVEIEVRATGLNFRDVLWAQGLLPEDLLRGGIAGPGLGLEATGIVSRVGADVDLVPGTPVLAFAPACLASHIVARAEA